MSWASIICLEQLNFLTHYFCYWTDLEEDVLQARSESDSVGRWGNVDSGLLHRFTGASPCREHLLFLLFSPFLFVLSVPLSLPVSRLCISLCAGSVSLCVQAVSLPVCRLCLCLCPGSVSPCVSVPFAVVIFAPSLSLSLSLPPFSLSRNCGRTSERGSGSLRVQQQTW